MKRFFVYVRFPELPASHAEQTASVEAGSLALAAKRGLEEIRRRQHVKGRRISEAVLRVSASPGEGRLHPIAPEEE
ncbi:MAG: hypothetical protein L0387_38605 [Acidobacteria bacterium]|nr:hypothetical protein [Acidobacteriota bacterium]MCI0723166.1 hypothetical protein [Acidobacteriota bacterium]